MDKTLISMNWLDIVILVLLSGGVISGFKNGLIGEVASLAALILGIWGAIKFSWWTGEFLMSLGINSQHMHVIAFIVTLVVIVILIQVLAKFLNKALESLSLGFVNRLAGIVVGVLKSVLILSVLLLLLDTLDDENKLMEAKTKEDSMFYEPMAGLIPSILPFLNIDQLTDFSRDEESDGIRL